MLTTSQFYAGNVRRWHGYRAMWHSNDCIKSHQVRCVGLVYDFVPDPPSTLVEAARWHDQPEVILGDMPFTTKRDWPYLAEVYASAERVVIERYNVPQPDNDWEKQVIKFVDSLDAYEWVLEHAPEELGTRDWFDAAEFLLHECYDLGFDVDLLQYKMGD